MAENKTAQDETLVDLEAHSPASMHPILEAAFKYQKQLIVGVVAIVAVTAIYAGYSAYAARALNTAQAKLGTILIEASGDDKIAKLEGLLNSAPSSAQPAVLLELAQSCMDNEKFDKAATYWNQLSGTTDDDLNVVARMGKAKALIMSGKAQEGVTELSDLAGIVSEDFSVPVYRQLAVAAEAAGNTAKALEAYKKLNEQQLPDKPFIEFKIAQLEAK